MFYGFCLEGVEGFGDPKLETATKKKSVLRSCTPGQANNPSHLAARERWPSPTCRPNFTPGIAC